jgi:hypothetical protein
MFKKPSINCLVIMAGDGDFEPETGSGKTAKGSKSPQLRNAHIFLLFGVWRRHPPVGELAQDRKMKPGGVDVTVWQPMVDCFNKELLH